MKKSQQLLDFAYKAMEKAYAPYSNLKVGAAILSAENNIYSACNVENISYPCGTCAEAGAIAAMITAGEYKISKILIISNGKSTIKPCGACLQRINEFSDQSTEIIISTADKKLISYKLSDLLPTPFEDF